MLVFPMIFLAGVFYSVDSMPVWMQVLFKINPATHGVDAFRHVSLGSGPAGAGLGVSVLGHTMSLLEEVPLVGVLEIAFLSAAAWRSGRQE
jgi:ABC-2 type transport system permease protein